MKRRQITTSVKWNDIPVAPRVHLRASATHSTWEPPIWYWSAVCSEVWLCSPMHELRGTFYMPLVDKRSAIFKRLWNNTVNQDSENESSPTPYRHCTLSHVHKQEYSKAVPQITLFRLGTPRSSKHMKHAKRVVKRSHWDHIKQAWYTGPTGYILGFYVLLL